MAIRSPINSIVARLQAARALSMNTVARPTPITIPSPITSISAPTKADASIKMVARSNPSIPTATPSSTTSINAHTNPKLSTDTKTKTVAPTPIPTPKSSSPKARSTSKNKSSSRRLRPSSSPNRSICSTKSLNFSSITRTSETSPSKVTPIAAVNTNSI